MLRISPVGLAAAPVANQVSFLAKFYLELCRKNWFCIDSSVQPSATVQYSVGTALLDGNTVFAPVTARVTLTIPGWGCNSAQPLLFTEQFYVAFLGQTALPARVEINSAGTLQNGANVKCGCARAYSINDSIIATLVPAAAPAATA